ncbi:MAG: hypothetical protein AAFQ51_06955 [Pseudomonadota bacterium]
MSKIIYSHRMQGVIQQCVKELGLTLTLSDENTDLSLAENEKMFQEVCMIMGVTVQKHDDGERCVLIFKK